MNDRRSCCAVTWRGCASGSNPPPRQRAGRPPRWSRSQDRGRHRFQGAARGRRPGPRREQAAPFAEKADALSGTFDGSECEGPRWHFIGHLQRNKARRVLERAHVIHSVDSSRLAEAITRICGELGRAIEVFVEVNLTGEDRKHGHAPEGVGRTLDVLAASPWVRVLGLMAMGPLDEREGITTNSVFESAQSLASALELDRGEGTFPRRPLSALHGHERRPRGRHPQRGDPRASRLGALRRPRRQTPTMSAPC